MNLKRIEEIYKSLESLKIGSVKFLYNMRLNRSFMQPYIDSINHVRETIQSEEYKEFDKDRIEIIKELCEKDSNGNPIFENEIVKFSKENLEIFNKRFSVLVEKYKEVLEKYEKRVKDLDALLEQKIDLQWAYIDLEDVPDEISDLPENVQSACFEFVK